MLWSMRGFAQAQLDAGQPNPFFASFFRSAVAVLWPLPAAVLLVLGGLGIRRSYRWAWLSLAATLVWVAIYPLVRPPQVYFYWLFPSPSK
jgi:drug/metabolite transporter (DMT)-like permease